MENEIKVGEYCRTTEGYIGKYIKDTSVKGVVEIKDNEMIFPTGKHNIVKHSPNLIDIIEERRLCKWKISFTS